MFPWTFGSAAGLAAMATLAACGPSFQAVHEGEARFEQCYALDEQPNVAMDRKASCWKDWAQHHTYGQTRDRVQYAVQRYQALSRAPFIPTDEALMSAAPGEGVTATQIAAPAPTSAFAPPPKTLDAVDAGSSLPRVVPAESAKAVRSPLSECVDECQGAWRTCRDKCDGKRCDECEKTEKACLRRCAK